LNISWQKRREPAIHEFFMADTIERRLAMQISRILELSGMLFSWREDVEAPNDEKILIIWGAGSAVFMAGGI
jgi:hypothetical protein